MFVQNAKQLDKDFLVLDGFWDYYKSELVQASAFYSGEEIPKGELVTLPHHFEDGVNFSSYHCKVEGLLPKKIYGMNIYGKILSCSRIWCNGQLAGASGFLNKTKISSKPAQTSVIIDLPADENGVIDILIHVADFELEKPGIIKPLVITEKETVEKAIMIQIFFSVLIVAFFWMLIIHNLILLVMNKKTFMYFSLVLLCFFLSFSIFSTGVSILNLIAHSIPFKIERRLYLILFSIDISAYILYMWVARRITGPKVLILYIVSAINAIATFLLPIRIFEKHKDLFSFIPIFMMLVIFLMSLKFIIKKNTKTKTTLYFDKFFYNFDLLVNAAILVALFYDFIIAPRQIKLLYSFFAFKIALFSFGIMQCAIPALRRYFTNYRIQRSAELFEQNNTLLSKFIPDMILKFMNAKNITKVVPGVCYTTDAMLLYAEIRHFKQLSESIEQKELFDIMTEYYKDITPIIQSNGGYTAKYMHHGCLAIFPERNDNTIRSAIKMQEKMKDIRRRLRKKNNVDISIGIAIHTGKIACGIIGSEKRLSSITFSSEIRTVTDIGAQTSKSNAQILISEDAMLYCRSYMDCMYEGHFIIIDGKRILIYSALPFKEENNNQGDVLELVEVLDEA